MTPVPDNASLGTLLEVLHGLIEAARRHVAQTANSTLTLLHWHLGKRVLQDILQGQRTHYGEEILPTLSAKLVPDYGKGFSARNLTRMERFAEAIPNEQIVVPLARQLESAYGQQILATLLQQLTRPHLIWRMGDMA